MVMFTAASRANILENAETNDGTVTLTKVTTGFVEHPLQ